jgi:hypothetical protein
MRTRIRWRAWLASLTVTVLAVAPLLAIFHHASTRHAVCEHGALIEPDHADLHGRGSSAADAHRSATDDASSDDATAFRADSTPELHGHAHCTVGTLARAGARVLAPTSFVTSSLSLVLPELGESALPRVRRILPIAPKTSPPLSRANVSA